MDSKGGEAARSSGELGIIPGAALQGSSISEANVSSTAGTFHAQHLALAAAARRFSFVVPGGSIGVGAVYNGDHYALQELRPGAGHGDGEVLVNLLLLLPDHHAGEHGEAFVGQLPAGAAGVVAHDDYGEVCIGPLPDGNERAADGIAGNDDGEAYENLGMVAQRPRRLLMLVGIGACSVAVNGLAAGPGSPAVAFRLFAMFLGGLLLVILHVFRA